MILERTADLGRHLDLLLHTPARDKRWIEFGKDLGQGQSNQDSIAIVLGGENVRSGLAEFAEGHFNSAS
jgi:hypothetical protein